MRTRGSCSAAAAGPPFLESYPAQLPATHQVAPRLHTRPRRGSDAAAAPLRLQTQPSYRAAPRHASVPGGAMQCPRHSKLTWRSQAPPAYMAAPSQLTWRCQPTPAHLTAPRHASLHGGAMLRRGCTRKLREGLLRDRCPGRGSRGGPAGTVDARQIVCHDEAVPPLHGSCRGTSHRHAASVMIEARYALVPLLEVPRLSGAATAWMAPRCA